MITASRRQLYFYTRYAPEKRRNDIEIDFLLSTGGILDAKVIPIEVKSSKNYSAISYGKFRHRFGKRIGESWIVHPKGFLSDENGVRMPTYMLPAALE